MKRIIVTGANGFIGSALFNKLQKEGYTVEGWDVFGTSQMLPKGVLDVDLMDDVCVMERLDAFRPDIIVHCAGAADVSKSVEFPERDFSLNTEMTHRMLFNLCRLKDCEKKTVLFLSSAAVYGNPSSLPISENMPVNPMSPYALHKVLCEGICQYVKRNYGTDIRIARVFSAYGYGLRKQILWDMYQKAIMYNSVELFGDGKESRDFINIKDLVNALSLLIQHKSEYDVFNIANGREVTIARLADVFAKVMKMDRSSIVFNGRIREGDPRNWRADITRMEELGYHKTVSLEEGIAGYVTWLKNRQGIR